MKRIESIFHCHRLDEIQEELLFIGIRSFTVTEAKGAVQSRSGQVYRGPEYDVSFVPTCMLIIYVSDELAPAVVETIIATAKTGGKGDGIVTVSDVEYAVNISSMLTGEAAL